MTPTIINKKFAIGLSAFAALTGFIILSIIPNMFIKKGLEPENAERIRHIVAHRGGAGIGLENTLSCIEKGIVSGAEMIEIDVHLTKDGYIIVCHDETVNRTTNGKGRIRDMTLSELRDLRIVDEAGNATEERLPTLAEVLELVDGRSILLIEVKRTKNIYQGIERKMMDEIERHNACSWVVVQSFNDSVLENLHKINPQLQLEKLLICKFFGIPYIFDGRFTKFSFEKYAYVASFNIFHKSASPRFIKEIHKNGKEAKIWTQDNPEKAPNIPVDGIITDRPDLWKKFLNK